MPLSETLTLTHGREFSGSSNVGAQWNNSDSPLPMNRGFFNTPGTEFADAVAGSFSRMTVRQNTCWVQFGTESDLALFNVDGNPVGARNDLMLDLYSPETDRWCRQVLTNYQTRAQRNGGNGQANFGDPGSTPVVAGRTYQLRSIWADGVEAAVPHNVEATFSSASSSPIEPPAPTGMPMYIGDKQVNVIYIGTKTVEAVYIGTKKVFQAS